MVERGDVVGDVKGLEERFRRAVESHRRGDLEGAGRLYREILKQAPGQFETLHYLGLLEAQRGNAVEGVELMRRAVAVNPQAVEAHLNLGNMLLELGRADEALKSVERAVELNAKSPQGLNSLGLVLLELGRGQEALSAFERALQIEPGYADAQNNRGNALLQLGRVEEALSGYERALQLEPGSVQVLNNRGNALLELKRYGEAIASFDRALALEPGYAEALHHRGTAYWELKDTAAALRDIERALQLEPGYVEARNSRGNVLVKLGRYEEALGEYEEALRQRPGFVDALSNRGDVLLKLKREEEALASCERALALAPGHAQALNNCGNVWLQRGDAGRALGYYGRALEVAPQNVVALSNRGNALMALNRNQEALASYDLSLKYDPEYAEANLGGGICRLLLGEYASGWQQYEWRWENHPLSRFKREFAQPQWRGDASLEGKSIFLHAEQGLGDTLQFCRYVSAVAARGATVTLEVQSVLRPLLTSLHGVASMIERGEPIPETDFHCPLVSLPLAFSTTVDTIPAQVPYLAADAERLTRWREKLGTQTKPRIGLVWSGSVAPGRQFDRTLPLTMLTGLTFPEVQWVSLQKDVSGAEKEVLNSAGVLHFEDELNDFADTAALVELMDLVITIDTSVAHLAGALAKPVWVLLRYAADWRWLIDRNDSPWYPSATLFRQPAAGDWESVIASAEKALQSFAAVEAGRKKS